MAKYRIQEQIAEAEHERLVRSLRLPRRLRLSRPRWFRPAHLALRVISAPARTASPAIPGPSPTGD
jgi:hypothetical protein